MGTVIFIDPWDVPVLWPASHVLFSPFRSAWSGHYSRFIEEETEAQETTWSNGSGRQSWDSSPVSWSLLWDTRSHPQAWGPCPQVPAMPRGALGHPLWPWTWASGCGEERRALSPGRWDVLFLCPRVGWALQHQKWSRDETLRPPFYVQKLWSLTAAFLLVWVLSSART